MGADWEVIEEKKHSDWGASQAHKRINCLGSLRMERNFANETSEYAAEGTKAHALCETMVKAAIMDDWKKFGTRRAIERAYFFNRHVADVVSATDMMDAAEEYVTYINRVRTEHEGCKILMFEIEHGFDISFLRPDLYGTCDAVLIIEWIDNETGEINVELHIFDFKYGAGVVVGALRNDQLAYYSLGAWYDLNLLYDFTRVTFHIVQPRVKNFDSWSTTPAWLTGEFQERLLTAYDASQAADAPLTPGAWCAESFCRARGGCSALIKGAIAMSGERVTVKHVWESDALAMDMITAVRAWCKAREEEIKQKILTGKPTDATAYFKVVQGRSSRNWDDQAALAEKYPYKEFPIFWHEPAFKSVAQVEKAIKDDDILGAHDFDEEFKKHVVKTPGSPTITRIEDSRVAIDKTDQARNEFMLEDTRTKEDDDPVAALLA